jgi:hypothetical protein
MSNKTFLDSSPDRQGIERLWFNVATNHANAKTTRIIIMTQQNQQQQSFVPDYNNNPSIHTSKAT